MFKNHKNLSKIVENKKVLIVDDDELFDEIFKEMLDPWFLEVDIALNAKEAYELLEKREYDIVISDLEMPEVDGVQLCKNIKKSDSKQKIIVISSHSTEFYLMELLKIGVDGYLRKPLKKGDLRNVFKVVFQEEGESHANS